MIWVFTTITDTGFMSEQFVLLELPNWEKYEEKAQVQMPQSSFKDMMASLKSMAKNGAEQPHASVIVTYRFNVVGHRVD